jgi:hypothetical protein
VEGMKGETRDILIGEEGSVRRIIGDKGVE